MQGRLKGVQPHALCVIGLIACSMLIYEILLTRICALRLHFHFSFLIISNCLLGIGASGTLIFIFQEKWRPRARLWIWLFCLLYLISLIFTYAFLLSYKLPETAEYVQEAGMFTSTMVEIARSMALFNLVAALPFFFAGGIIGMILTFNAEAVNTVYGVDLLGAGLGCLLCPLFLSKYGAGGTFVFLSLLALAGLVVALPPERRKAAIGTGVILGAIGLWLLPTLDQKFPVPSKAVLRITKSKDAQVARNIEYSRWSSNSRIDLVSIPAIERFIYCRGANAREIPLPDEKFILQDGSSATFIVDFSEHPDALDAIRESAYSATIRLKTRPRVFVVGVGGGNDVWAAKIHDADYVKGVELNRQILDIHRKVLPHFSRMLIEDPKIELLHAEGRNALMREKDTYDVIQMTGIDTWTALTSGAYILAENYLYTREAIEDMYDCLAPGGIIQIVRFAADMEALRLMSNVHAAFEAKGVPDFEKSVIALLFEPDFLLATMVKKGTFTEKELRSVSAFASESGFEVVYMPGRSTGTLVETFVRSPDKADFIRGFPRDISPTTDNRPYFFNFSKWRNPLASVKYIAEPTSVSQGNPAFLLGQFALSTFLSMLFIVLPLVIYRRKDLERKYVGRFLIYFCGLGIGFITIEIALMQKLVLFLGHPLYSITVTLFSILVFTGLGSMISGRWFRAPGRRAALVPIALAVLLGLFILFASRMTSTFVALPLIPRILIAVGTLAPIALVLGVPFAFGIRLLNRFNPSIIPWAWAVNGFCTVIGSILTVVLTMNLGFNFVFIAAIVIYAVVFSALRALPA
ncbi:MAG: hypothetical protein GTO51_00365 [Candidatus Latescibacteria bacterium]|nr:hypothetical protein [Candidatus Latescibacterota bacterium]NIM64435.1 hypothetical protein [Candidatus Latescibacterota bacterium]NIO00589.1 hypothetical protein [Candidatus Latescibacterota bacterium]NIO26989.1 hypothetical protein [Candidatus Latescibacterota bacterium]NIO56066.1 hypothetical protein [Candidatus Latescibacterota bacterium]